MIKDSSVAHKKTCDQSKDVTLRFKEEQLDLAKKWIQTGKVNIYRKTFTEEKSFTLPLKREELIIEKKTLDSATKDDTGLPIETIRILLSEEQVEFTKNMVTLEEVSIYKEQIEEIKHIEETLKREEANVKISGSINVTYK